MSYIRSHGTQPAGGGLSRGPAEEAGGIRGYPDARGPQGPRQARPRAGRSGRPRAAVRRQPDWRERATRGTVRSPVRGPAPPPRPDGRAHPHGGARAVGTARPPRLPAPRPAGSFSVHPLPPAAAGKVGGRQAPEDRLGLFSARGSAACHRRAVGGDQGGRARPGAARRHRLGKNLHHGACHRADPAPRPHPRPQQDAGGAALWRVPVVLPRQRGGIFRLLLRLLPARGLRPAHRHLYREGILHQRADRPHAPFRHPRPAGARRRGGGGLGLVHLRHRRCGNLFGHDLWPQEGRAHLPAPASGRSGGAAIPPQRPGLSARRLPRARRHGGAFPLASGGPRLARLDVRRRDRVDCRVRPAHRPQVGGTGLDQGLRQLPLRHAQAHPRPGRAPHQGRLAPAPRRVQCRRPHPGGPAPRTAHPL